MADKFGMGGVSPILKGNGHFPGQQIKVLGPRLVIPGLNTHSSYDTEYQYAFGEIVKILDSKDGVYQFRPMITADNANSLAVIMRDTVGQSTLEDGLIAYGKRNVATSLFLLSSDQHGSIAVPCASATSVAVGGTPYVGLGTNGTVAGAVYGAAQGSGGADSVALTGYEFKGLPYAPSTTTALAVEIGKKLDV